MSSRHLLPRVREDAPATSGDVPVLPAVSQNHRTPTMLRAVDGSWRRSFLVDLHEQVQKHIEDDLERERQKETLDIHRILKRLPENRDTTDIDTLYDWVMRNGSTIKIFQGVQEIICKTICREMTLLELPAKGVVCYQGDYGDVFFIIIAGSVSLYVETKKKLALVPPREGARAAHHTMNNQSDGTPLRPHERFRRQRTMSGFSDSSEGDFTPDMFGTFIKQIGAGGTFGELAVMDPTARRSCTIFCDRPTSFICLKRAAYQRLIRISNSSQLDFTQVEFLETLYFFEKWPHGELLRLSNRLRHMTFPADSHLARISTEANFVFLIYSGIVQETIPLVHHLNDNGNVTKCSTVESDAALRITFPDPTAADRKLQHQKRGVALEVNLYQEHDICGEFPIVFNQPTSNTDLLAVTDVKVLVMDRETWREVFFMHGLDHVCESHRRFRQLAQARETWRQTRLKLELANPGLHLTISTKAMMQDGKCMCGWCGSHEHITGDGACPSLVASKQKQADKQKTRDAERDKTAAGSSPVGGRRAKTPTNGHAVSDRISARANAVKNTVTFVNQLHEKVSRRNATAIAMDPSIGGPLSTSRTVGDAARPTTPRTPRSRTGTPRQSALRNAAQRIMSENSKSRADDQPCEPPPPSPPLLVSEVPDLSPRKRAIVTTKSRADVTRTQVHTEILEVLQAASEDGGAAVIVPPKVDEVRKGFFTDELCHAYRHALVGKATRIASVQQFYDTREKLLEQIQHEDSELPHERHQRKVPRKPKIPKPQRRLAMCSKTREPRPDRFNRKTNRMLRKMWKQDHAVPVVEESLRDV